MFSQDFAAEKSATVGEGIDPTGNLKEIQLLQKMEK
jgi:hypothetical protein